MYMCVAPGSTIPVLSGGQCLSVLFDTYDLVVGLQLKPSSYFKVSSLGLLSTTVLSGPTFHASLNTMPFASIRFVSQPILFLFLRGLKKHWFWRCGAEHPTTVQCLQLGELFSPVFGMPAVTYPPFFLRSLIWSVSLFISICCLATVSTETARLAVNSARGVPVAAVCIAAAAMLSRYPSKDSRIWWDIVGVFSVCSGSFLTGATPNCAEPPKVFFPSLAASERLFATYAARNVVFQSSQVWSSSGSFDHSRVSVSYSPDCRSDFNATACNYLSLITSFARFDLRFADSIAFINCGTPSESLYSDFIIWGISTASTVCGPAQNCVRWSSSLRDVTFV